MIAKCPMCGNMANLIVIDTRELNDKFGIRRRRECMLCKGRFTTYELIGKRRNDGNETSGTASGIQKQKDNKD